LPLPGRTIVLRVWQARIGKVKLYLLDSNDPLNYSPDRGATSLLYPSDPSMRLVQEIILGLGGWRVLEELRYQIEICHLNEGHAAFAVLARAFSFMRQTGEPFSVALRATRIGNVFTTHTSIDAAFDRFSPALIRTYTSAFTEEMRLPIDDLLALGRTEAAHNHEPFNMAYLAVRGSGIVNGVSRLHGAVSRNLFQNLFPRWPRDEVPITHVTNGVHMQSWVSQEADALWTGLCGRSPWLGNPDTLCSSIETLSDEELWQFRTDQRLRLIHYTRHRLIRQMKARGAEAALIQNVNHVLDPNRLTIGFARRFAEYKRMNLLLTHPDRLANILCCQDRPVQLIVAGKAHPDDQQAKQLIHAITRYASRADMWDRVVFIEDHDIALAQHLVAGIDVWLNTPRRPCEACGTSGMKVLVNGGLNLSELDGWWAEAYSPGVGWALDDGCADPETYRDDASTLYDVLERQVIPEYYDRDNAGIPRRWLARIRASMSQLTPRYSSNRMVGEYVERLYRPAAQALRRRLQAGVKLAGELEEWSACLRKNWKGVRFGNVAVVSRDDHQIFEVQIYLGEIAPDQIQVELYAESLSSCERPDRIIMVRQQPIPGAVNGHVFVAECPATRPSRDFTPRMVPFHPEALVPLEEPLILWHR
jgi:starch phosphorylase